ncbi:hypothetical protein I6F18_20980 [Bradyrhizobium sp. NBAIM32]|uniref:phospholipase D family protein n=1 Tax=Bradyrhizobium sp. NBAIM32 TaxID=2793809 RepID=UPI001CD46380|nr:phospholipase D family protein [Bradyrhizobium sp. NBAIM32]MCA1542437.1 hypothetical protein [Bradyrhizobium sp. NBAIM32]
MNALRPPDGYELDWALGTTYSLDLETLLAVPLSFGLLDMVGEDGKLIRDSVALLHVLRAYAKKLVVFCHASGIAMPVRRHLLYAHLEHAIIPVNAPTEGSSFHPKIWVLRFVAPNRVTQYRFLCLSRNLTGDQSWDTLLTLDGELVDRERAIAKNRPLAAFISKLAEHASDKLSQNQAESLTRLKEELLRVRFVPPEPFEDFEFFPMGFPGFQRAAVPGDARRLLIVSPFLSPEFLSHVSSNVETTLVSREETLDAIEPSVLNGMTGGVFAMIDAATGDGVQEATADPAAPEEASPPASSTSNVRGLHAKLYIAEEGRKAHVWAGSANATTSGFQRNVEFLTHLIGKKSQVGIDAFLKGTNGSGFAQFIAEYVTQNETPVRDSVVEENRKLVEQLRDEISRVSFRLQASKENGTGYRLIAATDNKIDLQTGGAASIRPITLPPSFARQLRSSESGQEVDFGQVSEQALTAFLGVNVRAGDGDARAELAFVTKAALIGAPDNRFETLLHHILKNPQDVIRYLLLLVHNEAGDVSKITALLRPKTSRAKSRRGDSAIPLLEELSRALVSSPRLLDSVKVLIEDLAKTAEGSALVPRELTDVWQPIWKARMALDHE